MSVSRLYDDGRVSVDPATLTIRRYYFPLAASKRIPLSSLRRVAERRIGRLTGQWRLWGSGDFNRWWNLDVSRVRKTRAFELDTGGRIRPVVTPDDPDAFAAALERAAVHVERAA